MTDNKRREIARDFIALHKVDDLEDWTASLEGGKDPLLKIYYSLLDDSTCNDDSVFYYEIGSHESKTGNAIIFEFENQ